MTTQKSSSGHTIDSQRSPLLDHIVRQRINALEWRTECGGVEYSAALCSAVEYSAALRSSVEYSVVLFSAVKYRIVLQRSVEHSAVLSSAVKYSAVQYALQYSTVQCVV